MSIGDGLPKGWAWTTISGLCPSMKNGIYKEKGFYAGTGTPCLRMYNIDDGRLIWRDLKYMALTSEEIQEYGLSSGDILVNRVNSRELVGKACLIPNGLETCVFESKNIRLRIPSAVANPAYLNYYLLLAGRSHFIRNLQQTVGMASINQDQLGALRLPLAPRREQDRIVAKIEELFSDLDAGVAALERAKAKLKRYRAAVLKAAVEGKLTEQWRAEHPTKETAADLLKRILKQRRSRWEQEQLAAYQKAGKKPPANWQQKYKEPAGPDDASLPGLPKGWCWATVGQLCFMDVGFAFKSAEFVDEGIRLLRGENIEPGALRWNDVRYWPNDNVADFCHLLINEGDIVLAMDRPLISSGLKIAMADASDLPCLLVQRMARLRWIDPRVSHFMYGSLQTHSFIAHLLGEQTGTQLPHISAAGIGSFLTPLPPFREQTVIASESDRRLSLIQKAESQIDADLQRSRRLRQSILKRAFEGALVPQDQNDEPASALLARIGTQGKHPNAKSKA